MVRNQSGISLIEVMVAAGVGMVIMLGMSTMMTNQAKMARQVEAKNEAANTGSVLKLMMGSSQGCAKVLRMDVSGVTYEMARADLPFPGTSSPPDFTAPIASIRVGEATVAAGDAYSGLTFSQAQLANFSHLTGMDFLANFQATFQIPSNSAAGMSQVPMTQMAALKIRFEPVPGSTSRVRISSCQMSSVVEPQPTCVALGGRWLEGSRMPIPRCNMGGDLSLAVNEAPDGIPLEGGTNPQGERVETCYRQLPGATQVTNWQCPGISTGRAGNRCAFVNGQWGIWNYNAAGVRSATNPAGPCARGVKVSLQAPETTMLTLGERIGAAFDGVSDPTTLTWAEELDLYASVKRCKYSMNSDQYQDCSTDPKRITEGLTGACIYVRGVAGAGGGYVAQYGMYNTQVCAGNTSCQVSSTRYTGWIRVTQNRALVGGATGLKVREARGIPCFDVVVQPGMIDDPNPFGTAGPQTLPPTADQMGDPTQIQQCIVRGAPTEAAAQNPPSQRETYYRCDNTNVSTDPGPGPTFLYPELVGGAGAAIPSLTAGSCWYVSNTNLTSGYIAANGSYTGWVQFRAALPDDKFAVETTVGSPGFNGIKPKPGAPRISAWPCNGGVRVQAP